jgi:hypothetical protein
LVADLLFAKSTTALAHRCPEGHGSNALGTAVLRAEAE